MIRILIAAVLLVSGVHGAVVGVDVTERSDVLDGMAFGEVGAYERIVGKARFVLDPKAPANQIINDLNFAPRNAAGLVEASADIYILRPSDASKANGAILFQVLNRGNKGLLRQFNYGSRGEGAEAYGDGFLMRRGYALVWVGWQFDLIKAEGRMRLFAPEAKGVTGWVRSAFRSTSPAGEFSVAGPGHVAYPALDPQDPSYRLIEREFSDGPGKTLPRDRWTFSDSTTVALQGGFTPGKSYEVVYRSKDPGIAGLGPAAIRDFVSYLRFDGEGVGGARKYDRAIAFGSSQSGRFLRTFLYDGYNADEQGRQVFDGVWPHIAGAARGSFTHRFAQPTRTDPFYTTDVFPFRDVVDRDPATGAEDGILARSAEAGVVPKIFYTNTSNEYWGRSASMIHTTIDGERDAPIAENTRIYHFTGTQHGAGSTPPATRAAVHYAINSNDYRPMMRALLDAFDSWIKDGRRPPASRYPLVEELTTLEAFDLPAFEGSRVPGRQRKAMRLDYGPEFRSKGIAALEPPRVAGPPYAAKVPRLDADGNEIGGIKLPSVAAPLATYAGWNLNSRSIVDSVEVAGNTGSTMPFIWTGDARLRAGDERRAVLERYESREKYLESIRKAFAELTRKRYLIEEDVERIVDDAARMWDYLAAQAVGSISQTR